jgi:outer membrane usher protein
MSQFRSLKLASEVLLVCAIVHAPGARADDGVASATPLNVTPGPAQFLTPVSAGGRELSNSGIPLFLSVKVNGMDHGLARFALIGQEIWAARAVLAELGLSVPDGNPDEFVRIEQATGARVSYDALSQSITFMVAPSKLAVATSHLNFNNQDMPVAQSATGALVNYDVYANYSGDRVSLDAFTEARAFSGNMLLENTTLFRHGQPTAQGAVRLDTTAAISFPRRRLTLRAGDLITRGTSWSRPVRMGGLRFGTDFALQPYIVTAPIPSFFGEAALPSTVDL